MTTFKKYTKNGWGHSLKARVDELRKKVISQAAFGLSPLEVKLLTEQGNIGACFYVINDDHNEYLLAHSQIDDASDPLGNMGIFIHKQQRPVFKTMRVDSRGIIGQGHNRDVDSESKIFEELHKRILNYPEPVTKIEVFLYTEREPCISCEKVIDQFMHYHPNAELEVYYDKGTTRVKGVN
ncbi:deaminase domain-containing protein [Paenibacillus sp. Soil750]|uniref:deaminase domain-containing protein n=1 Tax=Paenibacillus sp. Soil750 TaxID=1736398 RepID=UPI0006FA71FF|nr:deaminase domain-containing protein [Paenibacillus sp. Soil750]KRE70779.1 hypothetical protein ASL11_10825 [Paenibacillus sp. Soil750]